MSDLDSLNLISLNMCASVHAVPFRFIVANDLKVKGLQEV